MNFDFKKFDEKISVLAKHLENEVASLRTGRATPALLENVRVEAYGISNPLKNVASIIVEDPKTLLVEPWDKSLLETISRAIEASNAGVRPVAVKDSLRISLPPLTQERRQALLRVLKEKLEETRISLRKIRDEIWKEIQGEEKNKKISEDQKFRLKEEMEERIRKAGEKLEAIAKKKEKEIIE